MALEFERRVPNEVRKLIAETVRHPFGWTEDPAFPFWHGRRMASLRIRRPSMDSRNPNPGHPPVGPATTALPLI